jgi:hypothetical protein
MTRAAANHAGGLSPGVVPQLAQAMDNNRIDASPAMLAQRRQLGTLFGPGVPRAEPEDGAPVQRKVGVEYETNWKVTGENRANHKKPIFRASGWRIESDNNNLEFVVEPPQNSPEGLRGQVDAMGDKADAIRSKVGGAGVGGLPVKNAMGDSAEKHFHGEKIVANPTDPRMTAKAQFSFGVTLANLEGLLNKISQGNLPPATNPEGSRGYEFKNGKTSTTREFLANSVAPGISKSDAARGALSGEATKAGASDATKGFVSYLGYYIESMQTQYDEMVGYSTLTEANRAGHLGQELLSAKPDVKVADIQARLKYGDHEAETLVLEANLSIDAETLAGGTAGDIGDKDKEKIRDFLAERTEDLDYPKYRFTLMNRSGFDRMYQTLPTADRNWIGKNIDSLIQSIGRQPDDPLFASPYTFKTKLKGGGVEMGLSAGPTIGQWLESIVRSRPGKRDKISPPREFIRPDGSADPEQSLGALNMMDKSVVEQYDVEEEGGGEGGGKKTYSAVPRDDDRQVLRQTVIELRSWGDYIAPADWSKHSFDMAFLFNQLAPGELESDYERELVPLLQHKADLLAKKKKPSGKPSRQKAMSEFNRGINKQVAQVDADIRALKRQYGK